MTFMQGGARWYTAVTSLQGLQDHQVIFWGKASKPSGPQSNRKSVVYIGGVDEV